MTTSNTYPSFREALLVWIKIAIFSFGGPANQIAVMHRLIVEEKKWLSEERFLHALNYCMLLPGPEAHQLVIYIGWLLYRTWGGIVAGSLFVLPGFLSILILSILYVKYQNIAFVQILFYGVKAAIIAIVLEALIRIGKKVINKKTNGLIAFAAFIGIFFFQLPFPIIILSAAILGLLKSFYKKRAKKDSISDKIIDEEDLVASNPHISSCSITKTSLTIMIWLFIWFLPVIITVLIFHTNHVFSQEAIFFSKAAIVTFGGAYSVLAYIAQQAVQNYGWLNPSEMLDGLGMAETTPGPLIQVVQFIGFLAAYRFATDVHPLLAGFIGSILTTWVTFVPSFLWILAGAPYIERLKKIEALNEAFAAITAAVVGVILNLSVWFSLNTLFKSVHTIDYSILRLYVPSWPTFDVGAFIITLYATLMIFFFKKGLFFVLGSCILLGFIRAF